MTPECAADELDVNGGRMDSGNTTHLAGGDTRVCGIEHAGEEEETSADLDPHVVGPVEPRDLDSARVREGGGMNPAVTNINKDSTRPNHAAPDAPDALERDVVLGWSQIRHETGLALRGPKAKGITAAAGMRRRAVVRTDTSRQ